MPMRARVTGFEHVLPIEKLETELDRALSSHARIYAPWTESYAGQLRARYPFRESPTPRR